MEIRYHRFTGYILGFILFYAPFAIFQKIVNYFFTGQWDYLNIHKLCLRKQIESMASGNIFNYSEQFIFYLIVLLVSAIILGPVLCGKLCPAGGFTEYISRIIPDRLKIDWSKYVDITPLRYGMLTGFMGLTLFGGTIACSFCNYYIFDLTINYIFWGYTISFSGSLLLTALLYFVLFGLFTKGGRGYCNFLCPVGAIQNLVHSLACKFLPVFRIKINQDKCIGCGICAKKCPMSSIMINNKKASNNLNNCIICGECIKSCPKKAITYTKDN